MLILVAFLPITSALLRGTRARQHIQADGEPAPVPIEMWDDLSAELGVESARLSEESPGIVIENGPMFLRQLHERMSRFVEKNMADHPCVEVQADRSIDHANDMVSHGFAQTIPGDTYAFESKLAKRSSINVESRNVKVELGDGKIPEVATTVSGGFEHVASKSWHIAPRGKGGGLFGLLEVFKNRVFGFLEVYKNDDSSLTKLWSEITVALKPIMDVAKEWAPLVSAFFFSNMAGLQILLGIIYGIVIMRFYPKMSLLNAVRKTPEAAEEVMGHSPLGVLLRCEASPQIVCSSCCAWGARAAHTYHSTRIMNYCLGLLLMSTLPCCTIFFVASCCGLRKRLGGSNMHVCESCLCSFCCGCCMIAQEAQALDYVMGVEIGLYGLERKVIYD